MPVAITGLVAIHTFRCHRGRVGVRLEGQRLVFCKHQMEDTAYLSGQYAVDPATVKRAFWILDTILSTRNMDLL
jgi:hypothetical protein